MPKSARCLIVDDDPVARKLARTVLMRAGCEVEEAGAWQSGLASFFAKEFDVLLVDVQMPGVHGDYLVKTVKRRERGRKAVVVLVSSLPPTELATLAETCGADGWISKPFAAKDVPELLARVVG